MTDAEKAHLGFDVFIICRVTEAITAGDGVLLNKFTSDSQCAVTDKSVIPWHWPTGAWLLLQDKGGGLCLGLAFCRSLPGEHRYSAAE